MNKIRGQNENDINLEKGEGKIEWIEEKVRIEISNICIFLHVHCTFFM